MPLPVELSSAAELTGPLASALRLALAPVLLVIGAGAFIATRRLEPAHEEEGWLPLSRRSARPALLVLAALAGITASLWIVRGPPELEWTRYRYVDKRWILAAYWSGVVAVTLVPFSCVARRERNGTPAPAALPSSAPRPRRALLARTCLGIALATLLYGPPWNVAASTDRISPHEQIHLSGLQAIDRGYTPYLGAASVNYGPGLQLAMYGYMRGVERFTISGFREWYAVSLWVSLSILFAILFAVLAMGPALVACGLTLLVSPVTLWNWTDAGVLTGYWGWATPFRAIGPLVLAMLLYSMARVPRPRGALFVRGACVGAVWALFAYLSQENLSGGLVTVALIAGALRATGMIDARGFRAFGLGLGAGFGGACLPVVAYYAAQGGLAEFWRNYTLVPARFLRGYANHAYGGGLASEELRVAYYALPYVVLLLVAVTLYRSRPLRLAASLDRNRLLIFAATASLLAALPQALLRADFNHFLATLLALPLVLTVAVFHLPALLSRSPTRRWIVRLVVVLLAADLLVPTALASGDRLARLVQGRVRSFSVEAPGAVESDEVGRRLGSTLEQVDKRHASLMRELHEHVGDRPALVLVDPPRLLVQFAGYLYFFADLQPGPIWLERSDLVGDDRMLASFRRHLRENIEHFDAVVSFFPTGPEIEIFQAACPDFTSVVLGPEKTKLYVYCRRSP